MPLEEIYGNSEEARTEGGSLSLLVDESGDQFAFFRGVYEENDGSGNAPNAMVEKVGPVPGSYSLFNPFNIFRYSKLGLNESTYSRELQLDSSGDEIAQGGIISGIKNIISNAFPAGDAISQKINQLKDFKENNNIVENPTASNIIRWAMENGKEEANGAVPYTSSDFVWCKYYGKVPNNRMVTLRRYPIPIEDDLRISTDKAPIIPIAQAVTWYGKDIGNDLKNIINLNWGLKWDSIDSKIQDVTGNEITVDQIANAVGLDSKENEVLLNILKTQIFSSGSKVDILKISGYDENIQKYIRDAYGENGPYWNRILGPVNVINKTQMRLRGFDDQTDIKLTFEYSLRSYGGINPKIAFLDLLSNFLSLTYNTAPFWGGGVRYFQKTGVTVPALAMENHFLDGDVAGGIQVGLEQMAQQASVNIQELLKFAKQIQSGEFKGDAIANERERLKGKFAGDFDDSDTLDKTGKNAGAIEKLAAARLGKLLRKPLSYRAILDGRAVGEWHVTVGNPMNPIAMIGNLCLDTVNMEVGEILGIDDFPTEFKFTVKLKHGRPRAKQDIESIFNLGNGAMSFSELAKPSSANNTHGERNTQTSNSFYKDAEKATGTSQVSDQTKGATGSGASLESSVSEYSRQVRNMYGEGFGTSEILKDYFKELKTKD